jgi:hypothetical protein
VSIKTHPSIVFEATHQTNTPDPNISSMKHLLLLILPLLAFSFRCNAEDDGAQLVYDTDNHEVNGGESYYALPAEHGSGGGLRMFLTRRCNYLVYQAPNETDVGIPIRFHLPNDRLFSGKIFQSTNVTISFHIITTCAQTMYWHAVSPFPSPSQPRGDRVAVGKDEGRGYPMPLPQSFVFRIERYNGTTKGYKLVSCASKGPCKDLGLYASKERTWLAVSDRPFVVVFKKYIYP